MNTMIVDMRAGIDEAAMAQAGEILQAGGLVAFPTETVYGLGRTRWTRRLLRRFTARRGVLRIIL